MNYQASLKRDEEGPDEADLHDRNGICSVNATYVRSRGTGRRAATPPERFFITQTVDFITRLEVPYFHHGIRECS